jgi:hypothetical protein
METNRIIYIGRDSKYFTSYAASLEKNLSVELVKKEVPTEDGKNANLYLKSIADFAPDIIVIDYSEDTETLIKLTFFISRLYPIRKIPLIGFLSNDCDHSDEILRLIFSGVNFLFFKLFEIEFASVATLMLLGSKSVHFPDFAIKRRVLDFIAKFPARVGYISTQYLHIETNFRVDEEQLYLFEAPFLREGIDPEKLAAEEETEEDDDDDASFGWDNEEVDDRVEILYKFNRELFENIYYCFSRAYDISPYHYKGLLEEENKQNKDKYLIKEKVPQEEFFYPHEHFEAITEIAPEYEFAPDGLHEYFLDQFDENAELSKRSRLLIIDQELEILNQSKQDIDKFNANIRLHQHIPESETVNIIAESKPGVIVYVVREDTDLAGKELNKLKLDIEKVRGYFPFLIIWDTRKETGRLDLLYDKLLYQKNPFDFNILIQIMGMYEKQGGRTKTHDQNASYGDSERRYYLSKKDKNSFGFFNFPLRINLICEAYLVFSTDWEIPFNSNIFVRLDEVTVVLTVIETPQSYESICPSGNYFAVITALSEGMQTNLRKFIFSME